MLSTRMIILPIGVKIGQVIVLQRYGCTKMPKETCQYLSSIQKSLWERQTPEFFSSKNATWWLRDSSLWNLPQDFSEKNLWKHHLDSHHNFQKLHSYFAARTSYLPFSSQTRAHSMYKILHHLGCQKTLVQQRMGSTFHPPDQLQDCNSAFNQVADSGRMNSR